MIIITPLLFLQHRTVELRRSLNRTWRYCVFATALIGLIGWQPDHLTNFHVVDLLTHELAIILYT